MRKEKRILKCPTKLFHLSKENHNDEWFKPRVPASAIYSSDEDYDEDKTIKRVCFSKSISGAFYAISFDGYREHLYVHVPENIEDIVRRGKLYKPSTKQVYDAEQTDEYWVKCKVKMKCIGIITIKYNQSYYTNRPKCNFKWLKRY